MRAIRLILHTHWDREWYLPFERFAEQLLPTIDLVLDTMRSDPRLSHFHLDGQVALVDDYIARRPERAAELRSLIDEGRLSCGPWIALVDEFLVSGESIVRSLDDGLRRGDDLGGALRVGYVPDQFGHIGQLPQILANAGIGTAVTWRGVPAAVETGEFLWRSPDGSEVLVSYMPFGYAQGARMEQTVKGFVERLERELARSEPWLRGDQSLMLMTGNDHEQLNPRIPDLVDRARASGIDVAISSLNDSVGRRPASDAPVVVGELRSAARANLLPNTYSVRPHQKVERAGAELILERYAEPLAALVPGFEWPEEALTEAWYLLHLNGAHDSVCGCSTDEVAHAVDQRTRAARAIANRIAHEAFDVLRKEVDGEGDLVFNMSPFEREGVPPLGWSVTASRAVAEVEVVPVLEDGWLTFRHEELVTSLRLVDQDDHGDLYTFEPSGPPRYATSMVTDGAIATCSFEGFDAIVRATRHPADEFLRLHFEIDNRFPDHRVQIEFATQAPALEARAGSPFEIVTRPAVGEGGDSEPPPRQWPARGFLVAGGTCVLGEGVIEYELGPDGIGVTLIRCTGTISRRTLTARKITAGPDVATPEAQLIGPTSRSFGVASTEPVDPVGLSETFSASLMRMPVSAGGSLPSRGRLLDLDVPALSAVYRQNGRLLVRVWNPWGEPRSASIGDRELELGPHRIETVQLGEAPVTP
jgi:Glycosyl hydrolases family 38 N-terminal domain/Alpha mannosidase middle domain